ncbi:hypothetical protein ACPWML_27025, partial [Pandoraea pneumonica]|uniref:hypothetical protein n=1 Tax=Pandoraea pneumonica TaxID=2508299 RepID=UPI003CF084AD
RRLLDRKRHVDALRCGDRLSVELPELLGELSSASEGMAEVMDIKLILSAAVPAEESCAALVDHAVRGA